MRNEAISTRPGVVRIQDVRAALGEQFWTAESVTILAVGTIQSGSAATTIRLGWMRRGRANHRALVCSGCGRGVALLHVDGRGGLACIPCGKQRTRRQQERHLRDFRQLGGKEEDEFLRLLAKGGLPAAGLDKAIRLAGQLVRGDQDRVAALLPAINSALGEAGEQ